MRPVGPLVADGPVRRPAEASGRAAKAGRKAASGPKAAPVVRARARVGDRPRAPGPLARLRQRLFDRRQTFGWQTKIRLAFVVAAVLGLAFVWTSGLAERAVAGAGFGVREAAVAAGLTVQKVTVLGRRDTDAAAVMSALGVRRGDLILDVDTETARARLERLSWVRSASVRRMLPDTIHVELVERSPLAVWQNAGKRMLVDREGHVIEDHAAEVSAKLPLVVGEGAPDRAAALLAVIAAEPKLAARVVASVRVGKRRWDIKLDNGITVQLPETGEDAAWRRLAALDREHGLLGRAIEAVDMRLSDRLVVRMTEEAARSRLGPAKNT